MITTWSIIVFIIHKWPSLEHWWCKFDYACQQY